MSEREQKNLRDYCAYLLKDHGFNFSPEDPIIPLLYIGHTQMLSNKQNNETLIDAVNKVVDVVKEGIAKQDYITWTAKRKYHAIFGYLFSELGIAFKWSAIIAVLLIGFHYHTKDWDADHSAINQELIKRIQKNEDGYYYIDIHKNDKGTKFINRDPSTIRIIIGKE